MEEKIVHRPLFTTQWKRPRWKTLTSSYARCVVSDGLDLTEVSCKPVSIQTKSEATPASYSFHAQGKMNGP